MTMQYVEGFVTPVPKANKDAYIKHAKEAVALFEGIGATRLVENWADDVPAGKVTDFARAVKASDDEIVCFSWIEYPSKAARDAANEKMSSMDMDMNDMPFDGKRMIWSGFKPIVDVGGGRGKYVDGFLAPVRKDKVEEYRAYAQRASGMFLENGALRVVETLGDDVSEGKTTDYRRAVAMEEDETLAYSWIEWPDKATRDAAWDKIMKQGPMPGEMPFDGKRMVYGGFETVVDG